jgi:putative MATE family efflux protein
MAQARAVPASGIFDESRPMWRLFLVFLIPLILSTALQSASQTVASIYLGRLIGVNALAAVSAVFPILFLLISFMIGLASGSTVLIGQAYGAKNSHAMKRVAATTLTVSILLGILTGLAGALAAEPLLELVRTPSNILGASAIYARIVFASLPIFFPYISYTTFLRGTGDSKTPLYFLIVSTVIVIILTPALILGWLGVRWGVESAAVAGVIANLGAFVSMLVYLNKIQHPLRFDREMLHDLGIDWKILASVVRIGVPTGIQVIMVALAEIAVISFVNHFGSRATAAYGAVNQIAGYVQFPAMSVGITASIFGAQCIGAKREDKLQSVVRSGIALNYAIAGVLIGICYAFAWIILGWFITEKQTLDIAHQLLMITLWSYLLFGNASVLSGVMRSSGTVFWPTAITIFSVWAVEVPAAYILMRQYGLDGVWMGYPSAYCALVLLQFAYYAIVWKKKTHERLI